MLEGWYVPKLYRSQRAAECSLLSNVTKECTKFVCLESVSTSQI